MADSYSKIVKANLRILYANLPGDLGQDLPGVKIDDGFEFEAFGQACRIQPGKILLGGKEQNGVLGILISLYALNANPSPLVLEPMKSFKDFPNSMPYSGAFVTHTQNILIPFVDRIQKRFDNIISKLRGSDATSIAGGDFSFWVKPLPKVSLCYIFYNADDDFPASVTCLYSRNAISFLPIDALADVGEYTSREIINLVG